MSSWLTSVHCERAADSKSCVLELLRRYALGRVAIRTIPKTDVPRGEDCVRTRLDRVLSLTVDARTVEVETHVHRSFDGDPVASVRQLLRQRAA